MTQEKTKKVIIYTDGGARGNPGPAAIGFVVYDSQKKPLTKGSHFIGEATNNVAEYSGVIYALKWLIKNKPAALKGINFFLDSLLVVNQLNGLYKIKNAKLRNLAIEIRSLENTIGGNVLYRFVPREENKVADSLVNQALDQKLLHP